MLLMLNGIALVTLSPLALCALRKEEHDFMIIVSVKHRSVGLIF